MGNRQIIVSDKALYDRALSTIRASFARDPMLRWMVPEDRDFAATIPEIFGSFADAAFDQGTAYMTEDGSAVALWLPPGVASDSERMSAALMRVVQPELRPEVGAMFGAMKQYHPPEGAAWELPMIGVDPDCSGKGIGSALMQFALERCDASGHPAFLDSSNPQNVPFYQRLGFRVLAEVQHMTSPTVRPMLREVHKLA